MDKESTLTVIPVSVSRITEKKYTDGEPHLFMGKEYALRKIAICNIHMSGSVIM